jgi:hypothetical protein
MKLPRRLFTGLVICTLAGCASSTDQGTTEKKPGMFSRVMGIFGGSDEENAERRWKNLVLTMKLEPLPIKLGETRQLKVTLQLTNRSKKFVQLEFPTTQRLEVVVKRKDGKLVEQWSEDHSFSGEPSLVTINPGERLEYAVSVATRDMVAGEPFVVAAFFPNYEPLRVEQTVVPEK